MKTREGWTVVKGTTWEEHEKASWEFWKRLDPMDGMNLTWELSREWAIQSGVDVDAIVLRDCPATLYRPLRALPRLRLESSGCDGAGRPESDDA